MLIILSGLPSSGKSTLAREIATILELEHSMKTIIIAIHDDYLIELANRVITFEEGKIVNSQTNN